MTTPKIIFEEKIARHLTENNEVGQDVQATYQFNISGDNGGNWYIEVNATASKVNAGEHENPDCIITMKDEHLVGLVSGSLNPQLAFMTGKLKVKGDLSLALKLGKILRPA